MVKPVEDKEKACNCSTPFDTKKRIVSEADAEKEIDFENSLHNHAYVKKKTKSNRQRREIPIFIKNNDTTTTDQLYASQNSSDNSTMLAKKISEKVGDSYISIYKTVNASTNMLVLKELKHYSVYTITIKACREKVLRRIEDDYCSYEMLALQRTREIRKFCDVYLIRYQLLFLFYSIL